MMAVHRVQLVGELGTGGVEVLLPRVFPSSDGFAKCAHRVGELAHVALKVAVFGAAPSAVVVVVVVATVVVAVAARRTLVPDRVSSDTVATVAAVRQADVAASPVTAWSTRGHRRPTTERLLIRPAAAVVRWPGRRRPRWRPRHPRGAAVTLRHSIQPRRSWACV